MATIAHQPDPLQGVPRNLQHLEVPWHRVSDFAKVVLSSDECRLEQYHTQYLHVVAYEMAIARVSKAKTREVLHLWLQPGLRKHISRLVNYAYSEVWKRELNKPGTTISPALKTLSAKTQHLLAIMTKYCQRNGPNQWFASNYAELAELAKLHKTEVVRGVRSLEASKLIERRAGGSRKGNRYADSEYRIVEPT